VVRLRLLGLFSLWPFFLLATNILDVGQVVVLLDVSLGNELVDLLEIFDLQVDEYALNVLFGDVDHVGVLECGISLFSQDVLEQLLVTIREDALLNLPQVGVNEQGALWQN